MVTMSALEQAPPGTLPPLGPSRKDLLRGWSRLQTCRGWGEYRKLQNLGLCPLLWPVWALLRARLAIARSSF